MKHVFFKGKDPSAPTLVLFHGTGGTEEDLVPLGRQIDPGASLLGIRGNVQENGMPRFFRRIAEGVFDEEDLIFRTGEVKEFLDKAASDYGFDRGNTIAVGYSNGANIAGSLLFHYQGVLRGALLHHPMVPRRGVKLPDLTGVRVFIGAGSNDPVCAPSESEELERLLAGAGADVHLRWEQYGHRISPTEIQAAVEWYRAAFPR